VSILPEIFDGRERAREAQGCRVMGGDDISHDRDTPGSPDQRGNHPITQYPKGMGRGNVLGVRSITPGPQRDQRGIVLFETVFISLFCEKTP